MGKVPVAAGSGMMPGAGMPPLGMPGMPPPPPPPPLPPASATSLVAAVSLGSLGAAAAMSGMDDGGGVCFDFTKGRCMRCARRRRP
jgi:hypothetical protein